MFNAIAKVTTGIDKTDDVKRFLDELAKKQVYVGIPEGSDNDRSAAAGNEQNSSNITNAELLYIHTHGIRQQEMRDEMDPKVEGGTPYSKAFQMFLHTYGSPLWQSPPRPVIEPAIENSKEVIAKQLQKVVTTALDGKDPTAEMQKAGMLGQNIVRDWFTNPNNGWAPNAPATIKEKGSDKPLIDTGELRKAITYVISDGK
jgi:hypothetical protein